MRFHIPSFLQYLERGVPADVGFVHHHYVVFLVGFYPLRTDFLQELTTHAVIDSYDTPMGTPDGTEARSLIGGLLDTHREQVARTLTETDRYLRKYRSRHAQPGERFRYEYHISIQTIMAMLQAIRLDHDCHLITNLIEHEETVSVRKLEKLLMLNTGQAFSKRRISSALHQLEAEGLLSSNGRVRTHGREVL